MSEILENSTSPKGKSGTLVSSGIIGDEYIASLTGREAAEVYAKMEKSDYQVKKILAAIQNPIKSSTPSIEPVSQDPADVQVAAIIDKILLKDLNLTQKLSEILTFIPRGYSVFEVVTMNKVDAELGPYTGLAQLGFRDQASLDKWIFDTNTGVLTGIEQKQQGDLEVDTVLDAKFLVIFYNEKKGDDNGTPMLRPLYGPYKRKLLIEELKMIGIERSAIPTPKLQVPAKVKQTDQEYIAAVRLLQLFTSGENSYIIYPEGWNLDLTPNVFDPTKLESTIKSEDEKMAGSVLAMFVELGTGGNAGSLALSENLEKFFTNGIVSFANIVTDTINERLIPFLCRMNFGDTVTKFPKLKLAGIGESAGTALMTIITGFTNAGVVTKDPALEDHVRRIYKLPPKAEGEEVDNGGEGNADDEESTDPNGDPDNGADDTDPPAGNPDSSSAKLKLVDPSIALAEKASKTITKGSETVSEVMREKLTFIKEKMINDIIRYYKQLPEGKKLNAVKSVTVGGTRKFKDELKAVLSRISAEALKEARSEVPSKSKVKLKADEVIVKGLDPEGVFKFDDYSKLPPHVQLLLSLQVDKVTEKLVNDLSDRVSFQFMQSQASTDSADLIAQDLNEAGDAIINAGAVDTAATNVTSTMVNETRSSFFFDSDVLDDIASFTFVNADPVSQICQTLAGKTFATNDAEFLRYSPPLHHNCKSYLSPNLKESKNQPEITGLPTISESAKKSITLSENKLDAYKHFINNICKGHSHAH